MTCWNDRWGWDTTIHLQTSAATGPSSEDNDGCRLSTAGKRWRIETYGRQRKTTIRWRSRWVKEGSFTNGRRHNHDATSIRRQWLEKRTGLVGEGFKNTPRNSVNITRSMWFLRWVMRGSQWDIKRQSIAGSALPQQRDDGFTMNGKGNDRQQRSDDRVDEVASTATVIDEFPSSLFLFYFLLSTAITLAPLLCAIALLL